MALPWFLGLAVLALVSDSAQGSSLQVSVEQGVLQGFKSKTHSGNPIYAFKEIPYAAPPVGPLRFKEPAEPEKWKGTREARQESPICIQRDIFFSQKKEIIGQEDCLYLNVFTPKLPQKGENATGLPVLVFFHGGGWLCGNCGTYGPQYLLDQDIILVVPNYRLGAFGFLSTEDEVSPGNYGLKDQVAALKWVGKNIGAFGGDKGMITIAGESAGGASVHYHMISPLARGLFRNGISMSGTVFAHWAFSPNPIVNTKKLAIAHGCPFEDSAEIVDCLRQKDAAEIVEKTDRLYEWGGYPILPFRPSVEPLHKGQVYLPASRESLIKETERLIPDNSIPWMAGFTSHDGAILTAFHASEPDVMAELERDFSTFGPLTLNFTASNPAAVAAKIKQFYLGDAGKFDKENHKKITKMYTERQFVAPLVNSVKTMRRYSTLRPIYLYQFGYRGKHSMTKTFDPTSHTDYGVCHMDELQYLFSMPAEMFPPIPRDPKKSDYKMMQYMTKLVTNFATTDYPTPTREVFGDTGVGELEWYAIGQIFPLEIADLSSPKPEGYLEDTSDFEKAYKFWKSLDLNEEGWSGDIEYVGGHDEL